METDGVTELHTVRILAQGITARGYKPDEVHHGQQILDDLIVVEGRGCGDAEIRCVFFSLSSRDCPRDTKGYLMCAPKKDGEQGTGSCGRRSTRYGSSRDERPDGTSVQFVKLDDYAVFKLTGEWP